MLSSYRGYFISTTITKLHIPLLNALAVLTRCNNST
jgi:hypothetical protein